MNEKCILCAVNTNLNEKDFNYEIEELKNLSLACELEVVDTTIQNLKEINSATYFGKGKLDEVKIAINAQDITIAIFNDELTPSQISNLEKNLEVTIYDRTYIILEIFKRRAKSKEAILQVEISSLKYLLPRLTGMREGLSRQRGDGGMAHGKGTGETKLELDRRQIQSKITLAKKQLEELTSLRKQQRVKRIKSNIPIVSLVGYTNSGKSSTLNSLLSKSISIKKEVLEKDMLFATLETSTRLVKLPSNKEFLVTDTVGFVQRLPHHLVEAFKSTLEEITESDLIIHVVDASNENFNSQIEITENILKELGVKNIPIIYAFNKIDKIDDYLYIPPIYENAIRISTKNGHNIDNLIDLIINNLYPNDLVYDLFIDYSNSNVLSYLKENALVNNFEYQNNGIYVNVKMSKILFNRLIKEEKITIVNKNS